MADGYGSRRGTEPTRHRHRRSSASEERLRALGERIPVSPDELEYVEGRRVARHRLVVVGAILVVLVALAGVRWFGPVPPPTFVSTLSSSVRLPGPLPSLPWPTTGAAALGVEGAGSLGSVGGSHPAPIAGLAAVMTAFVVLRDHPLTAGADGPAIPVTTATSAAAEAEAASQQSVVPVAAGETLTERQALEGLLVAQGNDMATLLADWDAGSGPAFVGKMNAAAHALGLDSTTFTDPSGLDTGTVSTPTDLIRLGEAAMAVPTFAQIVAMAQVTLPLAGLVYNLDADLGQSGIVGIKTGSDSAAGGCFLFQSEETVDGKVLTLVGAVLGQEGESPNTAALDAAVGLVNAAFAGAGTFGTLLPAGSVGRITAPWGPSVAVTAGTASVVGWPGLTVPARVHVETLPSAIPAGAEIGVLHADLGGQVIDLVLRVSRPLHGPSAFWRLTRL
ncbi:MAG: D-alanyl-D-alanine carboxypeptidase [Acidimicrobiales bacterium]|jgi:D-alanyl-D-alanine carboxypeptidase (penicillin-binding protein 5/6)